MKLPLKAWLMDEAQRLGITPRSVYRRLSRGKYLHRVGIRRENPRVVFVLTELNH